MVLNFTKVEGFKKDHKVRLYALSTCGWCHRLKEFMKNRGVSFEYVDVDLCSRDEKREITLYIKEHGLPISFPLTVVDDSVFISGYKLEDLEKTLGLVSER
jgi:glutaredoxin